MIIIAGAIVILASALCACTAGITSGPAQVLLAGMAFVYGGLGWILLLFGMSIYRRNQAP